MYCAGIIIVGYKVHDRFLNPITIITVPYMLIVTLNNILMTKYGFYSISDQSIVLFIVSIFCVFIGSLIATMVYHPVKIFTKIEKKGFESIEERDRENKLDYYRMEPMVCYIFFVDLVCIVRLLYYIKLYGFGYLPTPSFEGKMNSGALGHLLLTAYPLVPICFYFWIKNKKKWIYLVATALYFLLIFSTFIKYHVIGLVMVIYFLLAFEENRYMIKGAVVVISAAVGLFLLNYVVSFYLAGTYNIVSNIFYFNHLWNYIAGSLIHDNYIFTLGKPSNFSLLIQVGRSLIPPINIVLNKLFGIQLFYNSSEQEAAINGLLVVGTNGEQGNVLDAFGEFFPGYTQAFQLIMYLMIMVFAGVIFTLIYKSCLRKLLKEKFPIASYIFFTYFIFFSFFGRFYTHFLPWELIGWGVIMPLLFSKRVKFLI